MTNAQTTSARNMTFRSRVAKVPDHAPMSITRLSGWIDVSQGKVAAPNWIIPTRAQSRQY